MADCSELDFEFLARQFPLAGGHIRSIMLNACLMCAGNMEKRLTMECLVMAVKREYEKIEKPISMDQFGPYADIIRQMEREHV